ncbi:unnamed protein product [Triticum turgidum subsp. durum]|nr:unnamed protein product [Triticum turgidum subsp. durum]
MAMRAGREGLDGGAAVQGIALLDPYFWGKRPVPSETRDPAERRLNDRIWSFVCAGEVRPRRPGGQPGGHGERRVAAAGVRARAGDRGQAGRAEREGPRVRGGAQGERVGRRGAAVRDARREPRLPSLAAGRREGGEGDGCGGGLHQRRPVIRELEARAFGQIHKYLRNSRRRTGEEQRKMKIQLQVKGTNLSFSFP